ncbi:4-hydroxy-2-oxovalerate aldolase [Spirochaetia bacterium]|nr:4-hydroxy-2-oxovalerate aldolase [Spirochaetia bacterium]
MNLVAKDRLKLLDCTLRDGGFANDFYFGNKNIHTVVQELSKSKIDIIELGFLEIDNKDGSDWSIYPDMDTLAGFIPKERQCRQLFSSMITYPGFPIENVPQRINSNCDIIRIIIRYSELRESLEFCKQVAEKGYAVSIQAAITTRYSRDELQIIFDVANEINAYSVYIVDTYGYMQEHEVIEYFKLFNDNLKDSIRVGFHAHNNINLAFSNTIAFINYPLARNIVADSCLLGMGQGAGNLQTELFVDYLNKNYAADYEYEPILEACEIIEKFWGETSWGYSVVDMLSAINRTSYKYSRAFRKEYSMSFVEINRILSNITEELRHRYTPEDTKRLAASIDSVTRQI